MLRDLRRKVTLNIEWQQQVFPFRIPPPFKLSTLTPKKLIELFCSKHPDQFNDDIKVEHIEVVHNKVVLKENMSLSDSHVMRNATLVFSLKEHHDDEEGDAMYETIKALIESGSYTIAKQLLEQQLEDVKETDRSYPLYIELLLNIQLTQGKYHHVLSMVSTCLEKQLSFSSAREQRVWLSKLHFAAAESYFNIGKYRELAVQLVNYEATFLYQDYKVDERVLDTNVEIVDKPIHSYVLYGKMYLSVELYDDAIVSFKKALAIACRKQSASNELICRSALLYSLACLDTTSPEIHHQLQSCDRLLKEHDMLLHSNAKSTYFFYLAHYASRMKQNSAIHHMKKSIELQREGHDSSLIAQSFFFMATFYFEQDMCEQAYLLLEQLLSAENPLSYLLRYQIYQLKGAIEFSDECLAMREKGSMMDNELFSIQSHEMAYALIKHLYGNHKQTAFGPFFKRLFKQQLDTLVLTYATFKQVEHCFSLIINDAFSLDSKKQEVARPSTAAVRHAIRDGHVEKTSIMQVLSKTTLFFSSTSQVSFLLFYACHDTLLRFHLLSPTSLIMDRMDTKLLSVIKQRQGVFRQDHREAFTRVELDSLKDLFFKGIDASQCVIFLPHPHFELCSSIPWHSLHPLCVFLSAHQSFSDHMDAYKPTVHRIESVFANDDTYAPFVLSQQLAWSSHSPDVAFGDTTPPSLLWVNPPDTSNAPWTLRGISSSTFLVCLTHLLGDRQQLLRPKSLSTLLSSLSPSSSATSITLTCSSLSTFSS
mmetsp:Transcript_2311/g.3345  ORF Transcript_2311/g.3345 Transcript_2311/m.3345 type:complete len:763 (-) Transcript_2311:56-2344(-)